MIVHVHRPSGFSEEILGYTYHRFPTSGVLEVGTEKGTTTYAPGEWSIVTVEVEDE